MGPMNGRKTKKINIIYSKISNFCKTTLFYTIHIHYVKGTKDLPQKQ